MDNFDRRKLDWEELFLLEVIYPYFFCSNVYLFTGGKFRLKKLFNDLNLKLNKMWKCKEDKNNLSVKCILIFKILILKSF